MIRLVGSEDGVLNGYEGEDIDLQLETSGFSYGNIPLRVSLLSYSEFEMAGYSLEDHFESDITSFPADGKTALLSNSKTEDSVVDGASALVR